MVHGRVCWFTTFFLCARKCSTPFRLYFGQKLLLNKIILSLSSLQFIYRMGNSCIRTFSGLRRLNIGSTPIPAANNIQLSNSCLLKSNSQDQQKASIKIPASKLSRTNITKSFKPCYHCHLIYIFRISTICLPKMISLSQSLSRREPCMLAPWIA